MYETQLKAIVREAKAKIQEQNVILKQLTAQPTIYAPVISTGSCRKLFGDIEPKSRVIVDGHRSAVVREVDNYNDEILVRYDEAIDDYGTQIEWVNTSRVEVVEEDRSFVVVAIEGKLTEVESHPKLILRAGDFVKLSTETMQIVDVADSVPVGELAVVHKTPIGGTVEVNHDGSIRMVFVGKYPNLERGDRVVLDASLNLIVQNLGKEEDRFNYEHETNVSWDDIGGLEEEKQQMVEAIEMPFLNKDLYRFYGKKPIKGVLLYGPPGCGKTMLGKATATALARLHGRTSSSGFMYVKAPEILDKFIGNTEATIRQLFERARHHYKTKGYPAVIFIDEADAILRKRGSGISSDMEGTIVPMFLTEMDGLEESNALVILATNRPDTLDPAVVRDGRIDRKIKISRPEKGDAVDIFKLYLSGVPLNNGYSVEQLSADASAELFSATRSLYTIKLKDEMSLDFSLAQLVNGGMIAGIVDKATSIAIRRDLEAGEPGGLKHQDLIDAVDSTFRENIDLDHSDEIVHYARDFGGDVVGIERRS